jgi:soluble lytic murein transglycosylase-like protein
LLLTLVIGKTAPAASHLNSVKETAVKPADKVATVNLAAAKTKVKSKAKPQPKPAPRPQKVVRRLTGGCSQYAGLVSQYAWNVTVALAVMKAESGCNPLALSPTADRGLMQVNAVHAAKVGGDLSRLYDPATNIRVAFQVYSGAGWKAWSVCNRGIVSCY